MHTARCPPPPPFHLAGEMCESDRHAAMWLQRRAGGKAYAPPRARAPPPLTTDVAPFISLGKCKRRGSVEAMIEAMNEEEKATEREWRVMFLPLSSCNN